MKDDKISEVIRVGKAQVLVYELRVEAAMSTNVCSVSPDDTMEDVRKILKEHAISGLPVVAGDELKGIVSIEDLIESILEGKTADRVSQRMTREPVTICSDDLLVRAINDFGRYRYGRFPVINRQTKKLVGIITKGDIIRCLFKRLESNHYEDELRRYRAGHLFEDIRSDHSSLVLKYNLEGASFEKAGEGSSQLKKNLLRLGIHPDVARRITIASYEAEMNMVIFCKGGTLIATIEPRCVTVNAVDQGPGIPDIARAMEPGYSTAPDWVRELGFGAGMGLPNIKNCSDEMHLDSTVGKGTNLQFKVYTKK
ncbi:MAG: CBS domain-containing protein [Ignavibacteria bacterium]|nr:CBS domain-containing protein [Ignavibacteria bacterium]